MLVIHDTMPSGQPHIFLVTRRSNKPVVELKAEHVNPENARLHARAEFVHIYFENTTVILHVDEPLIFKADQEDSSSCEESTEAGNVFAVDMKHLKLEDTNLRKDSTLVALRFRGLYVFVQVRGPVVFELVWPESVEV